MQGPYDLILVGGGLANGLIALRLKQARPELRLLIIEQAGQAGGNHTWSFHDTDLDGAQRQWLAPLIGCHWSRYRVVFPQRSRILDGGYASIFSADFAQVLAATMGKDLLLNTPVRALSPTDVALADGQILQGRAVIDGRGAKPTPYLALGYQAFLGQEVRLRQPHGLQEPVLMDASVDQGEGYRFVYLLPFSGDTLLIEDTHYVSQPAIDKERLRGNIGAYARTQGWHIDTVQREESGVLPITLAGDIQAFWREAEGQPRSGLRAGLFHPTTGYSLPHAVRLADRIAGLEDLAAPALFAAIHQEALNEWRRQGYFRLLNRMLFLAGPAGNRWRVMQRFYGLSEQLIRRFYGGRLTTTDKLRILLGKPPVPLGQAFSAACRCKPQSIKAIP